MSKVLRIKKVFSGKLLKLYLQRQRYPGGYVADLEIVRHPGAVLIVPFLGKDKIVLIKQYRPVLDSFIWEFPAGTLNDGEGLLSCAKRELAEEIGYQARAWSRLGRIFPAPGYTTEKITIFAAGNLSKVDVAGEEDELITPHVFSRAQVNRLLDSGKIIDAKTICALKLLDSQRRKGKR